jgi:hypothetical protein
VAVVDDPGFTVLLEATGPPKDVVSSPDDQARALGGASSSSSRSDCLHRRLVELW